MRGVEAYDCKSFHPECTEVEPIEGSGFMYLWCNNCRVLARLEAVANKFPSWVVAAKSGAAVSGAIPDTSAGVGDLAREASIEDVVRRLLAEMQPKAAPAKKGVTNG